MGSIPASVGLIISFTFLRSDNYASATLSSSTQHSLSREIESGERVLRVTSLKTPTVPAVLSVYTAMSKKRAAKKIRNIIKSTSFKIHCPAKIEGSKTCRLKVVFFNSI